MLRRTASVTTANKLIVYQYKKIVLCVCVKQHTEGKEQGQIMDTESQTVCADGSAASSQSAPSRQTSAAVSECCPSSLM